jgi:hypothetical protein
MKFIIKSMIKLNISWSTKTFNTISNSTNLTPSINKFHNNNEGQKNAIAVGFFEDEDENPIQPIVCNKGYEEDDNVVQMFSPNIRKVDTFPLEQVCDFGNITIEKNEV